MSCCKDKRYIIVKIEGIHRVIDVLEEELKGSYMDLPSAYQAICGFLLEDQKNKKCKKYKGDNVRRVLLESP
jgi:hypothetical protein